MLKKLLFALSMLAMPALAQVTVTPPESNEDTDIALLGDMEVEKTICGWSGHQNTANKTIDNNPITLRDTVYTSGVCTHATSQIIVKLNGATRFVCRLGIDDEVINKAQNDSREGRAGYKIMLRGEDNNTVVVAEGNISALDESSVPIDINTNGWKYLILENEAGDHNWSDHVDWANAYFEYYARAATAPYIVSTEEIASKLACATTMFSQPGVRYMHKIKATSADAVLAVENLPAGLSWNAKRKLVEGIVTEEGVYNYDIVVALDGEESRESVKLTVSSKLQQPVPFMGWLSWNVYQANINEANIKATADAMVRYKLNDYGYTYLCLDDNWHADAREDGTNKPLSDDAKFPKGMNELTDYIHSLGLKAGIYSDAADLTCNNEFGSYGYEEIDAKQYAEWGFDLLKYDYCHAPSDVEAAQKRYKAMGDALKNCGRDILFYMCEWGQRDPWKWGAETGATCWRATYDSRDTWDGGVYNGSHCGAIQAIDVMKHISVYSGPNRFNDADMMCVGLYGKGIPSSEFINGKPGMTVTEYKSQFAMWCMFASPLTISFDITEIPQQDLDIITNEELIAIDQDRMGQQADLIVSNADYEIYCKDLENGDIAVAVLNRSSASRNVTIDFSKLPLEADTEYQFRDLWAKENVGTFKNEYTVTAASHETRVFRVSPAQVADGITAATTDSKPITVTPSASSVSINCLGSQGLSKRVLISDLAGRVVAQTNSDAEIITLPLNVARGIYVANVVTAGHARSVKFEVGR